MAYPTQATIDTWNSGEEGAGTIGAVMDCAAASDELRAALLVALECDYTEHYRSVSLLSDEEVDGDH